MAGFTEDRGFSWRDFSWDEWTSMLALPLGVGIDALGWLHYGFSRQDFDYYMLVLMVSALTADRLARVQSGIRTRKKIDALNMSNFEYIGDYSDGIKWFLNHRDGLQAVDNTVYKPANRKFPYMAEDAEKYLGSVRELLRSDFNWRDLYFTKSDFETYDFDKTLDQNQIEKYFAKMLPHTAIPLPQIMVLHYKGGEKALLYGWGFDGAKSARVYLSKDEDTVAYFENYYDAVFEKGIWLVEKGIRKF